MTTFFNVVFAAEHDGEDRFSMIHFTDTEFIIHFYTYIFLIQIDIELFKKPTIILNLSIMNKTWRA